MVLSFVVGFPIYVAKDILQPSSIYPTISPDPKLLLEHFMVAQTNAYANSTCSPISPWSLAEDGIEIAIPPLYWILSAIQMLCYVAAIGMWYYTFLHRNVDFAVAWGRVLPGERPVPVERVNAMERVFLGALGFDLYVPRDQYEACVSELHGVVRHHSATSPRLPLLLEKHAAFMTGPNRARFPWIAPPPPRRPKRPRQKKPDS